MSDNAPTRKPAAGTLAVVAVALLVLAGLTTFTLRQGHVAVLTTLGQPARALSRPGLYAKLPWPIQSVHRFDGRLRTVSTPLEQQATLNGEPLLVEVSAAWQVSEPAEFLARLGDVAAAEAQLSQLLTTHVGAAVGRYSFGELLAGEGDEGGKLAAVEEQVRAATARELADSGVDVAWVGVRRLGLPEAVTVSVFERMRQERSQVAERARAEGEREANAITAEAELEASRILTEAGAEARRIEGQGAKAAQEAYRALSAQPELAALMMELEALTEIVGDGVTTVVIDAEGPALRYLREAPEGGAQP